ncbi:MAG: quercetin 2,3-dioxygenase, partial [Acidobacteria bacterium]
MHLLQIWIMPEVLHIQPSYEQKKIDHDNMRGKWLLIASRNPSESAVQIQQDAKLCAAVLDDHQVLEYEIKTGRHAWLQIARGNV